MSSPATSLAGKKTGLSPLSKSNEDRSDTTKGQQGASSATVESISIDSPKCRIAICGDVKKHGEQKVSDIRTRDE
jgi:hypothetical protein